MNLDYERAYKYADTMDWYVHGDINVNADDIYDLAWDAQTETNIPQDILAQAMIDYLKNELGYEV